MHASGSRVRRIKVFQAWNSACFVFFFASVSSPAEVNVSQHGVYGLGFLLLFVSHKIALARGSSTRLVRTPSDRYDEESQASKIEGSSRTGI